MGKDTVEWSEALREPLRLRAAGHDLAALQQLVRVLRPTSPACGATRLARLCDHLEEDGPETGLALGHLLRALLHQADCVLALTDSGIPSDRSFANELMRRVGRRVLPEIRRDGDLRGMVRSVFDNEADFRWLRAVPTTTWKRLLRAMGITAKSVGGVADELASSIRVLAHHAASLGLHPDLTERLTELDDLDSPFLALSHHVLGYLESLENDVEGDEEPLLDRALATVAACRRAVYKLRRNKHRYGTSLRMTSLTHRLLAMLDRLDCLLHLSEPVERDFQLSAVRIFLALVEAENTRNHLGRHVRNNADMLALQVVEHAAKKGAKYITTTWSDYGRFLVSSMGGGLFVAVFALFKVLLDKLDMPLAVDAFLFGVNYAVCFILIYLTGSTLATKQPAMTANTIARTMGKEGQEHQLSALVDLVARVWRSQFISFVGNLICALPVALAVSYLYELITGSPPIDGKKAMALLEGLHPWRSGSLFYAAVAGVFLFAAGLLSGYVDNRNLHRQVPARVARHPLLRWWFGPAGAERLAAFVDRNLGVLTGNVFLGFCLGSAGTIGVILGLPFDIRHIAFGASHFGMAAEALHGAVAPSLVLETMIGVALIGLVNFLVSFSLALFAALESRQVTYAEGRTLLRLLGRRLALQPWHFLVPPFGEARRNGQSQETP